MKVDVTMYHETVRIPLLIQLKTKIANSNGDQELSYRIDRKLYDEFRKQDNYGRVILLLHLPPVSEPWIVQSEDALEIKRRIYWICIRGWPAIEKQSITIDIPNRQVLDVARLHHIYECLADGEVERAFL